MKNKSLSLEFPIATHRAHISNIFSNRGHSLVTCLVCRLTYPELISYEAHWYFTGVSCNVTLDNNVGPPLLTPLTHRTHIV